MGTFSECLKLARVIPLFKSTPIAHVKAYFVSSTTLKNIQEINVCNTTVISKEKQHSM